MMITLFIVLTIISLIFKARNRKRKRHQEKILQKYGQSLGSKILKGQCFDGMTTDQVIEAFGKPSDIENIMEFNKIITAYKYRYDHKNVTYIFEGDKLKDIKQY